MPQHTRFRATRLGCTILLACLATAAPAAADGPVVPAFERFAESWDPATSGRLLISELNCVGCHAENENGTAHVPKKRGPVLDRVGRRVRPDYLRDFLAAPATTKPGTTMPDLVSTLPEAERAKAVEALTHFLATTGSPQETAINAKSVTSGAKLYTEIGCLACHDPRGDDDRGEPTRTSVPLGNLSAKYTIVGLTEFLQDPLAHRPSGRMPSLLLKNNEPGDLAHYLLRDRRTKQATNASYSYYEGEWEELPDFDKLRPIASGQSSGFDIGVARRADRFALRFEATFATEREGMYTITVGSDDGSRVEINGGRVVVNDGTHPKQDEQGKIRLGLGAHRVVVSYFEASGGEELDVDIEGPNLPRQPLAGLLKPIDGGEAPPTFRPDPALVERGHSIFGAIGCASCHDLKIDGRAIPSEMKAPRLVDLDPEKGCLAADPPADSPRFGLGPVQRDAIAAALRAPAEPGSKESLPLTLAAFNCYACHRRDGQGGVEEARNAVFATTQKEVGDEVRIPPSLDGVGAKLNERFLKGVLANGSKDRLYMLTRMPKFGSGNIGHLQAQFAKLDTIEPVAVPESDESPRRLKETGRLLSGKMALNCVSCHTFQGVQAAGIQVMDLTLMPKRLRPEWFQRYLVDPQAFRPGTRMPTSWPDGKSVLPGVLGGNTPLQIEAIWAYLGDGAKAVPPAGVGVDPIPLIARDEAVIYRNFIEGAGPRAIGVGYPEKLNLAFDANGLRLALVWQGEFIDASRHWNGRGNGFQPPLGENVLTLPAGPSFARMSASDLDWPTADPKSLGHRFRGYELAKDRRPTFRYDVGPVHIADYADPLPGPKFPTLRRVLTLTSDEPADDLYFRAAVGDRIEPLADDTYRINGDWTIRLTTPGARPIVRKSRGKDELILPIPVGREAVTVLEEIVW